MGSHSYHNDAPNFSPEQILHDFCGECFRRAGSPTGGLADLDLPTFRRAWARAATWQRHGLPDIAEAEVRLLSVLWSVQVHLQRLGWPIGELPALPIRKMLLTADLPDTV